MIIAKLCHIRNINLGKLETESSPSRPGSTNINIYGGWTAKDSTSYHLCDLPYVQYIRASADKQISKHHAHIMSITHPWSYRVSAIRSYAWFA
jgi:hypothetical protein